MGKRPERVEEEEQVFEEEEEIEEGEEEVVEDYEEENQEENQQGNQKSQETLKQSSLEKRTSQKNLKLERKKQKTNFQVIESAKLEWIKVNDEKLSQKDRQNHLQTLYSIIQGNMSELVFKHDASRMVQTCLKLGDNAMRMKIAKEIQCHVVELAKSVYGKHLIYKMFKYCGSDFRHELIKTFYGNVVKMIKHKEASNVIEFVYNEYANANEKASLIEEFYGIEFAVFKKLDKKLSLDQLLNDKPAKKQSILNHMKGIIQVVLGKGLFNLTLMHKVILEYLNYCSPDESLVLLQELQENVVEMLHTKAGSTIAMKCLAVAQTKDRKTIIKSFKPFLEKIFVDSFGVYVIIFALMNVDDTVLMSKAILMEYAKNCSVYVKDKNARKIALYLICGLSSKYFDPTIQSWMTDIKSASKKDENVRLKELNSAFVSAIIDDCVKHGEEWLGDKEASSVMYELLKSPETKLPLNEWLTKELGEEHILCKFYSSKIIAKLIKETDHISLTIKDYVSRNMKSVCSNSAIYCVISLALKGLIKDDELKNVKLTSQDEKISKLQEKLRQLVMKK